MSPEEKEKQKRAAVQWVLSTEQGRSFVWDLISFCGVYQMAEGETNQMLIKEGSRRVGLHILGITSDASEDLVFTMMQEVKNRSLEEKHEHTKHDDDTTDRYTTSGDADAEYDTLTGGYDSGESLPEFDRSLSARYL